MKLKLPSPAKAIDLFVRMGEAAIAWVAVWFVIALLIRALTPDPATQLAGPLSDQATRSLFAKEIGLDVSPVQDAMHRAGRILTGDLGISWRSGTQVTGLLSGAVFLSAGMAAVATGLSLGCGGCLAWLTTKRTRQRQLSRLAMWPAAILSAVPSFVFGLLIVRSPLPSLLSIPRFGFDGGLQGVRQMLLPVLSLTLPGIGLAWPRLRESFATIRGSRWYVGARALGLGDAAIIYHHGRPLVAVGLADAAVQVWISSITGAVVVEHVFGLPGLGTVLVDAVQTGDLPVTLGVVAVTTVLVAFAASLRWLAFLILPSRMRPGQPGARARLSPGPA